MAARQSDPALPWTAAAVLVVEDSMAVRMLVRRMLLAGGHAVTEAADGVSGLATCRAVRPDVVLLDVEMPGMSGWEVLAEMKADKEIADIPVVFLTGLSGTEDIVTGLRLGAHDYLRKPCEPEELLARVNAAARVKHLQDELRRRNGELTEISRTDALTGLPNRRHVEEQLGRAVSLAVRSGVVAAVAMVDIDLFKRVNDKHGHAGGDAVLREVSARLAGAVRCEDIVGRWGGEEFLAVLPRTTAAEAGALAERLRSTVERECCSLPDGDAISVTISVGCAASAEECADALVKSADRALYDAKAAGRNRVVVAELSAAEKPQALAAERPSKTAAGERG
jgi:two-component system, cell cycle response regulator